MTTALVLGGGGPVGVAWEVGVLAGLAEAGVDLTTADGIIGTSAGSIVGAHVAVGASPADLLGRGPMGVGARGDGMPTIDPAAMAATGAAIAEGLIGARPGPEVVADVAELSRSAATISEEAFIALVGDRSLGEEWPDRDYRCTAFDVDSAEFTVWSRDSGVPLSRAVASSCSVPGIFPPITIGDRRYMDGGLLSGTNAHLVSGADTVVIVSVMSRILPDMGVLKEGFDREVEELRAGGSTVEVIEFDDATIEVVAMDLMSSANSAVVAAIAVEQGKAEAERIGAVWG